MFLYLGTFAAFAAFGILLLGAWAFASPLAFLGAALNLAAAFAGAIALDKRGM